MLSIKCTHLYLTWSYYILPSFNSPFIKYCLPTYYPATIMLKGSFFKTMRWKSLSQKTEHSPPLEFKKSGYFENHKGLWYIETVLIVKIGRIFYNFLAILVKEIIIIKNTLLCKNRNKIAKKSPIILLESKMQKFVVFKNHFILKKFGQILVLWEKWMRAKRKRITLCRTFLAVSSVVRWLEGLEMVFALVVWVE